MDTNVHVTQVHHLTMGITPVLRASESVSAADYSLERPWCYMNRYYYPRTRDMPRSARSMDLRAKHRHHKLLRQPLVASRATAHHTAHRTLPLHSAWLSWHRMDEIPDPCFFSSQLAVRSP